MNSPGMELVVWVASDCYMYYTSPNEIMSHGILYMYMYMYNVHVHVSVCCVVYVNFQVCRF